MHTFLLAYVPFPGMVMKVDTTSASECLSNIWLVIAQLQVKEYALSIFLT